MDPGDPAADGVTVRLAFFVTPHGFGHATRAAALMQAIHDAEPAARFVVVTTTPPWIFAESLSAPFEVLPVATDVGLVQHDALREDLAETVRRLEALVPPPPDLVAALATKLRERRVRGVVCDIAPLGIAVARAAGVPSVLVENFTWDWIYEGYLDREPGLRRFLAPLRALTERADLHLQARPVCVPRKAASQVGPIARAARQPAEEVRRVLGIQPGQQLVLLTMGGVGFDGHDRARLSRLPGVVVALTGGDGDEPRREGSLWLLPTRGGPYHPDLVTAADAVVGKLGYSTVAEAALAGVPILSVERPAFRETAVLADYVATTLAGEMLGREAFSRGDWLERLPRLLSSPRPRPVPGGAGEAARLVLQLVR
jgi:UDP:flavonoid glycosyltransferase YjiC (YdhE family)